MYAANELCMVSATVTPATDLHWSVAGGVLLDFVSSAAGPMGLPLGLCCLKV